MTYTDGAIRRTIRRLWQWSVDEPDAFWRAVAEFFDVKFHRQPDGGVALASREDARREGGSPARR